ncbi:MULTISPECIES: hypothetical protein [Thermoanaerobacterium]|uniref:Uncharacterized protein n=3 Tax=Thermoanaerobacterium TaxID=28895 RepID=L0INU3_THETR|nr:MULTISPECIES: hypothetical protein [Thermoanaerobacterium]AFK94249.1 hypothetical protein Tsac_2700 [Thermoanaerobacterium saccharolyticum JW/SL-YS485]AGB20424.1 hypothetical protein Thethe_02875 [Thermoanaerobacterium thermosaccharolyticum M0795]ETO39159.1 hypothetical protein V518_0747 [Thermoanaerobacterium aotearoense SCUT27]
MFYNNNENTNERRVAVIKKFYNFAFFVLIILIIPSYALASGFSKDTINEINKLANWIWGLTLTFEGIWAIFNIIISGIKISSADEHSRKEAIGGLIKTGVGILLLTLTQYITGFFTYYMEEYYFHDISSIQTDFKSLGVKMIEITSLIAGFIFIFGIIYAALLFASPEGVLIYNAKYDAKTRERAIKKLTWTAVGIMVVASAVGIYTILVNL